MVDNIRQLVPSATEEMLDLTLRPPELPKSLQGTEVARIMSALLDRAALADRAMMRFDQQRDYNALFGYVKDLRAEDFLGKYARQAVAARIVDAPPEATWSTPPIMVASRPGLQSKWERLTKDIPIWPTLHRADRLSRLGYYSNVLIGLNDAGSLETPARTSRNTITYLRALGETQVQIEKFVGDPMNERFGQPEMYKVTLEDPRIKRQKGGKSTGGSKRDFLVHWSRMLHFVENPLDDDIACQPTIGKVFNLLDDLIKVSGGTPEIFWLNARGGLQADVDKEMALDDNDTAELSDEIDEYMHQLRRFIRTRGIKIKEIQLKVPDPTGVFNMLMSLLSGATGIPKRILLGSEAGQLASEQDRANWAERIEDRRNLHAAPYILGPMVKRLQYLGLLTAGDFTWEWPEAFRTSPLEEAQTAANKARAVSALANQVKTAPMQVVTEEEAREMIGLEGTIPDSERLDIPDPNDMGPSGTPSGTERPDPEDTGTEQEVTT